MREQKEGARGQRLLFQGGHAKKVRVGPRGAIMLNCNNMKGPWPTNPIILVKTQYQEITHGFHMSFRKPISGALRWGTLKVSNLTPLSFGPWSYENIIKIHFLLLFVVLRIWLENFGSPNRPIYIKIKGNKETLLLDNSLDAWCIMTV